MRLFKRKSQVQRLLSRIDDSLPDRPSGRTLKASLIAAGGLTGLTVGSARISSLRRRIEGESSGAGRGS